MMNNEGRKPCGSLEDTTAGNAETLGGSGHSQCSQFFCQFHVNALTVFRTDRQGQTGKGSYYHNGGPGYV